MWGDSGVRGGVGGPDPGLEGPAGPGLGRSPNPRARADSDSRIFPATTNSRIITLFLNYVIRLKAFTFVTIFKLTTNTGNMKNKKGKHVCTDKYYLKMILLLEFAFSVL